jgi:sensor c-di-GMP phosphodiesterase-like protein
LALAAAAALAAPPLLAWREAEREARGTEADLALGYARAVLHRADAAGSEAAAAIQALARSGLAPCSAGSEALMRRIHLTSPYIQALGHVRNDALFCSSLGKAALPLGRDSFRAESGYTFYSNVPVDGRPGPLVGVAKDGYAALIHRDLPLDIWTAVPGVSLAILHPDRRRPTIVRGHVDPGWLGRLDGRATLTFVDREVMVAIVHSPRYLYSALAAIPVADLRARTRAAALRLVPAGLVVGFTAAAAILLLARRRMSMAASLRAALRRKEFFLVYQPLVDLDSGAWVGVEALLRWRRATGELVGPDLFIPIAEQTGLISRLTECVLELAEAEAGRFLAAHPGFHIGINLSPADLRSPAVLRHVDRLLAASGAGGSNLMIEITERGFIDLESARSVIGELRSRGIGVAIDDFGTGYSSLSYLETLDLDYLKIDRSFIEAIGTGAPTSQVVGHIIAMARALDLAMIAEGVESEAQRAFLRANGVQYAQGWLFGKPMPFADVERALRASTAAPRAATQTA